MLLNLLFIVCCTNYAHIDGGVLPDDAGALLPLLSTRAMVGLRLKNAPTTTTTTHTHTHTFVVENCFANLVPKTKLSVFVFSTIFLVWPELILDKKENSDSCFLGKFLCWFELLG